MRNYVKWCDAYDRWQYYFFDDAIPTACEVARHAVGNVRTASVWRMPQHASWARISTIGYVPESVSALAAQHELDASEEAGISPDARAYRLAKARAHLQVLLDGYPYTSERQTIERTLKDISTEMGMLRANEGLHAPQPGPCR